MFRSSTILKELVQSLAKVTLLLKHSVKLRRILCGDVAACREMACVLFLCMVDTIKDMGWERHMARADEKIVT